MTCGHASQTFGGKTYGHAFGRHYEKTFGNQTYYQKIKRKKGARADYEKFV